MKKKILSVLISGSLLLGTIGVNAVSIGFEDLKQNNDESSIYLEDLEQSDKTSDLEETQIPELENIETVSENNILEANEADSYIDEYYFPGATEENIVTLDNVMKILVSDEVSSPIQVYSTSARTSSGNMKAYFTEADNITYAGNNGTETTGEGTVKRAKFSNTSVNTSKYVIYSNAVVSNNGTKYDLVIYPFHKSVDAKVGIWSSDGSKFPNIGTDDGHAGYKIVITQHGNISNPVSMNLLFGIADLDTDEWIILSSTDFSITHQGSKIATSSSSTYPGCTKYRGTTKSDSTIQKYDTNCVIGEISVSTSGFIFYYGASSKLAANLAFDEILDYYPELEPEPIPIPDPISYSHTLSYNANGGTNAPSSSTVTNTSSTYSMTVSSSTPTRTGYTFAGWNTNSSGTGTNYSAGGSVSVGANATVTLYAKWTPITYSITYNGNGNTGGSTASQTKAYDAAINLQNNGFTKTGYHFTGWNTASNGAGTSYSAGAGYSSNANLALYARWAINSSTLSVNPNGGTWNNSTTTQSFTQNYNTTKSIPVPTRTGYTFTGWTRSGINGSMSSLTGSATYTFGASNGVTDTITAEWKINNYTVTYIDVIDSKTGKELGRSTASKPYNSTVRGSEKGNSSADNAYYNGYYYVSDTSATVTTSGATVYRIFKQRMNTIAGNIIWEDWNNKNLSRPENVNLYISGSDGKTYSYVITGDYSQNTPVNRWPYSYDLPKYDGNGNVIVYTVSQDRAISQEKGLSYQEPLINGYDITNKITNRIINTEDYFQIPVTIIWDDENDSYGFRPETATIHLLQNGEVIKAADVSDSYTFTELLKYDENGDKYVYTIQASDEKRYTKVENNSAPYNKTVTYTFVNSYFSVLIPKVIVLDGIGGNANYDITVNGAFYYNDTLTVKPATSFVMTDRNSISSMKANVLQSKQSFTKEDGVSNGSITNGSIQVDRTNFAGLWKGTFNFDIKFFMQN